MALSIDEIQDMEAKLGSTIRAKWLELFTPGELQELKTLSEDTLKSPPRMMELIRQIGEEGTMLKWLKVTYRDEFEATILAEDESDAMKKFEEGKAVIEPTGMGLWPEYFEVEEVSSLVHPNIRE